MKYIEGHLHLSLKIMTEEKMEKPARKINFDY